MAAVAAAVATTTTAVQGVSTGHCLVVYRAELDASFAEDTFVRNSYFYAST